MGTVLTSSLAGGLLVARLSFQLPNPRLQALQTLMHGPEGPLNGVRQVRVVQIDGVDPPAALHHHPARHAHHRRMGRDLAKHHGARSDPGTLSHREGAEYLGPSRYDHVVADGGMAFPSLLAGSSQHDPLVEGDVLTDLGRLADHHTHTVVDEEPFTQAGARVDLDS